MALVQLGQAVPTCHSEFVEAVESLMVLTAFTAEENASASPVILCVSEGSLAVRTLSESDGDASATLREILR